VDNRPLNLPPIGRHDQRNLYLPSNSVKSSTCDGKVNDLRVVLSALRILRPIQPMDCRAAGVALPATC